MKQIKINSNCNQCGICVVKCPAYFQEDESGDVRVISSAINETPELESAVNACPVKAIELGAEINAKQSIQNYISELEKMKNGITVTTKDIEFHDAFSRRVYVPSAGMSGYSYKSSSQAERAGYDAFVSRCYSQIDNLILERITDYRGKDIYCYNANDASSELGSDLGDALRYAKSDIEDSSLDYLKSIIDSYNRNLKACIEKKISELKKSNIN